MASLENQTSNEVIINGEALNHKETTVLLEAIHSSYEYGIEGDSYLRDEAGNSEKEEESLLWQLLYLFEDTKETDVTFTKYEVYEIKENFQLSGIEQAIKEIDALVDKEWLGSYEEAQNSTFFDRPITDWVEMEGYFMIPMNRSGVAFDYGDTSSNGILLEGIEPFGESKLSFKQDILSVLYGIKDILNKGE